LLEKLLVGASKEHEKGVVDGRRLETLPAMQVVLGSIPGTGQTYA
jgi:hypothetical protein